MSNSHLVNRIAIHATADTAMVTLPASAGSNVAKATWTSAGYVTAGMVDMRLDDYDTDEDTFTPFQVERRDAEIAAPFSQGIDDMILLSQRLVAAEFMLYDIKESLLTLGSDITVASNIAKLATSYTARTVGIEIYNTAMIYIPHAIIKFESIEMGLGEDGVARTKMVVQPINTTAAPGGVSIEWY